MITKFVMKIVTKIDCERYNSEKFSPSAIQQHQRLISITSPNAHALMYNGNSISIYDVLRRTFMLSQTAAVHLAVVYVHPVYTLEINTRLKYLLLD